MNLFNEQINNEQDWWEKAYQSIVAFKPLVEYIFDIEKLPFTKIENLTPGTNAVFKVGEYVVKIFAPAESEIEQGFNLQTEIFAIRQANKLNISAPKFITSGFVEDKYHFAYIITEYIEGMGLNEAVQNMTDAEKINVGRKLRDITNKMNTPCESFNDIDVIHDRSRDRCWDKYPEKFKKERLEYIKAHKYGENIFAHGDLCGDNILLTQNYELYIIDFANAVLAPKVYEHALLVLESELDPMVLQGYFDDYTADEFIEMCFNGLLIADYDEEIVEELLGKPNEFQTLDDLRKSLKQKIKV